MKKSNKIKALMLAAMLSATFSNANALLGVGNSNSGGSTTLLGGGNGGIATGASMGEAGTYQVTQYDLTKIDMSLLNITKERQDENVRYLQQIQGVLVDELELLREALAAPGTGLIDLSIKSDGGNFIPYTEFLTARKDFNQKLIAIDTKLGAIFLLPTALNGQETANLSSGDVKIPGPLKVQLDGFKKHFETQKSAILGQITNATFNLKMPNGVTKSRKSIGWNASPADLSIPADKINQMRLEAKREMKPTKEFKSMMNEFNQFTKDNFRQVIQSFGVSQTYRFDSEDNTLAKDMNMKTISEIFWARDYLRAWMGIQLGTFGINYKIQKFEWNFFSDSNKVPWLGQFFRKNADLTKMHKGITEALRVQKSRNQEVLGKGVDFVDRIFSLGNMIAGQAQLSEINVMVLELIKRDIEMEMMLSKPGGRRLVVDEYRKRYYPNEEARVAVKKRAQDYKQIAKGGYSDDPFGDVGAMEDGTLAGAFSAAYEGMRAVSTKIDQAKRKLQEIEELEKFNRTNSMQDEAADLL